MEAIIVYLLIKSHDFYPSFSRYYSNHAILKIKQLKIILIYSIAEYPKKILVASIFYDCYQSSN
jgi:hypothetical protein